MWGRPTRPTEDNRRWRAGWRHPDPRSTLEQLFPNKGEAWIWLRAHLNWELDDHYTPELFRAAQACATMSYEYIQSTEYRVGETVYFLEPYYE